ncbi:MAG: hypothetical protein IJ740_13465, partial [Ruminococcus sp.]|nr:hypothetical protein [Ruminococcus sp.]
MSTKEQSNRRLGISSSVTDMLLKSFAAHPYLWTFAVCIFIHPFYLGAEENVPPNAVLMETLMVLAAGFSIIYYLFKLERIKKLHAVTAAVVFPVL